MGLLGDLGYSGGCGGVGAGGFESGGDGDTEGWVERGEGALSMPHRAGVESSSLLSLVVRNWGAIIGKAKF